MKVSVSRINQVTNIEDGNTFISVRFYIKDEDERGRLKEAISQCSDNIYDITVREGNMLSTDLEPKDLTELMEKIRVLFSDLRCSFLSNYIYVAFASAKNIFYEGTYNCIDDTIEELDEGEAEIRGIVEALKLLLSIEIRESPFPVYIQGGAL